MKKFSRRTLALILAAVSILTIPLYAGATTYSGSIGSNIYTCTVSCAPLKIVSKISCSKKSDLETKTKASLYYLSLPYGSYRRNGDASDVKSLNLTYNITSVIIDHPNYPTSLVFYSCEYEDYINTTNVLNGITEYSA